MRRLLIGIVGSCIAWSTVGCTSKEAPKPDPPAPAPVAAAPAAAAAPEPSPAERLAQATDLASAIALSKDEMTDKFGEDSPGALLFGVWAAPHLAWTDVAVKKDETSFALAQKDPDEARGKRMCVSGQIIQIEVEKTQYGKFNLGLMMSWGENLYRFIAVGSSGTLVEQSSARICGVVTGKYDYSNSGGGTGHAIELVGMFDLPENKKPKTPGVALATHL